jgi:hypothetical protein
MSGNGGGSGVSGAEQRTPGWLRGSNPDQPGWPGFETRRETEAQRRLAAALHEEARHMEALTAGDPMIAGWYAVASAQLRSAADDFRRLMSNGELARVEAMGDAEIRAFALAIAVFAPGCVPE